MNNYFTSFRLLTLLEVNNIRATRVLKINKLRKCTIIGTNSYKNRNVATLNSAHQAKKQCNFDSDWLEQQQGGLHRVLSTEWMRTCASIGIRMRKWCWLPFV